MRKDTQPAYRSCARSPTYTKATPREGCKLACTASCPEMAQDASSPIFAPPALSEIHGASAVANQIPKLLSIKEFECAFCLLPSGKFTPQLLEVGIEATAYGQRQASHASGIALRR